MTIDWWMISWQLPLIALWGLLVWATYDYWRSSRDEMYKPTYILPAVLAVVATVWRASVLILWQHAIWSASSFGRALLSHTLTAPDPFYYVSPWLFGRPGGYFIAYALSRFLMAVILSLILSLLFYWILKLLEKKNSRFFLPGEARLGFLCVLLAGWPGFVFFVPAVFLSVVLVSLVRMMMGHKYTTLGYPMILASAIALGASSFLQSALGLWVLKF
jgi:hypothetical protein